MNARPGVARGSGRPDDGPAYFGGDKGEDWLGTVPRLLLLAVAYFASARLGLAMAMPATNASAIWIPSGLAMAALLVFGYRLWPGVFLGALAANVVHLLGLGLAALPVVAASFAAATGNALEAAAAVYLVLRFSKTRNPFERTRDTLIFVLSGPVAATVLGATIGAGSFAAVTGRWDGLGTVWLTWWLGDGAGALIVAPVLVGMALRPSFSWRPREAALSFVVLLAILGAAWAIVSVDSSLLFLLVPLPLVAAVFLGPVRSAFSVLLIAAGTTVLTLHGMGPFATGPPFGSLLRQQAFFAIVAGMAMVLAAATVERKQAVGALEESTRDLRRIYDTSDDLLFQLAVEGENGYRLTMANRKLTERFGVPAERAVGRLLSELVGEPALSTALSRFRRAIAERGSVHWEEVSEYAAGGLASLVSVTPAFDDAGRCTHLVGAVHDMTEIRRQEENVARLAAILEHSTDFVALADASARVLYINPQGRLMLGLAPDADVLSTAILEFYPSRLHGLYAGTVLPTAEREGSWTGETALLADDGAEIPVWETVLAHRAADGTLARYSTVARDLREKIAAREAIERSEARYRDLFENAPVGYLSVDRDGRIATCNRQLGELVGHDPSDLVGRPVLDLYADTHEGKAKAQQIRSRFLAGEPVAGEEAQMIRSDGALIWVAVSVSAIRDDEGAVLASRSTVMDISQRKAAKEARMRSEQQLRLFVEYSPAAIAMFDRDMRYIVASNRYLLDYGLGVQNLSGRSHYDVFPEVPERWREIYRRCLEGAVEVCEEDPFPRADGHLDWVRWEIRPWHEPAGEIGGIILFSEVITARKRAEESLALRAKQLAALNDLSRTANASLDFRQVEESALAAILGAVAPDLVLLFQRQGDDLVLLGSARREGAPSHGETPVHRFGECLCGIAVQAGQAQYSRDIHADARCTWAECKKAGFRSFAALPLRSLDEVSGVLGLASVSERDFEEEATFLETIADQVAAAITNAGLHQQVESHVRELEQRVVERTDQLRVAMEGAQAADRLKSAFLATMSHELRTPLNSIIGFTGVLLQRLAGPVNDEQVKQLGMVKRSAQHLLSLINDVLDISKIEAGQLEIRRVPFDMPASLAKVAEIVAPAAEAKRLALRVSVAREVGTVTSDRRRVEQILLNLLSNAVKFTEEGEVRLEAEATGDNVVLRVVDTGIGIRPEDLDRLFQPFTQIDSGLTRAHDGTGLGLSICSKLAQLLGGTIAVASSIGEGSTFTVTLPLATGGGR